MSKDNVKLDTIVIKKVNPIIMYPNCIIKNGVQDNCLECWEKDVCKSPKSWCIKPYYNHSKGCPNFNNRVGCPPNTPMVDDVYDIKKEFYLFAILFDLSLHFDNIRNIHPEYTEKQIKNIILWQGTVRKIHYQELQKYLRFDPQLVATYDAESLGVDLVKTCANNGIEIHFPINDYTYRVALLGSVRDTINQYNYQIKNNVLLKKIMK